MNLRDAVVAILNDKGKIAGTGFLVGQDLLLTCAHVVVAAGAMDGDTALWYVRSRHSSSVCSSLAKRQPLRYRRSSRS